MKCSTPNRNPNPRPILMMQGIDKSFPGVHAVKGVDLSLYSGEVLALIGENGAGKSTLIKILTGAHRADRGIIMIDGKSVLISDPAHAQREGISVMYQELNTLPYLTVKENIFLGHETKRMGFSAPLREERMARELFARIGTDLDPNARCADLSVAEQQMVEIARALSVDARIIVMDEPTTALTSNEADKLFEIIAGLKQHGIGVIFISHRLEEIYEISDRVMVMRDGERVALRDTQDTTRRELIELMVGRTLEDEFPQRTATIGPKRLVVKNVRNGDKARDVSFHAHGGEILGIAGLVGSGRTETMRVLFGADENISGTVELDGKQLSIRSPADAIRNGICMVTEHRKEEGLIPELPVIDNFALPNLDQFSKAGFISRRLEDRAFARYEGELRISIPSHDAFIKNLSGGNQQKVILAKWLMRNFEVIIMDEPTRGIDVGAKYEIYQIIDELSAEGKVIIIVSSDMPELMGICDRILVMHEGKITGEIADVKNATQEMIMELAIA